MPQLRHKGRSGGVRGDLAGEGRVRGRHPAAGLPQPADLHAPLPQAVPRPARELRGPGDAAPDRSVRPGGLAGRRLFQWPSAVPRRRRDRRGNRAPDRADRERAGAFRRENGSGLPHQSALVGGGRRGQPLHDGAAALRPAAQQAHSRGRKMRVGGRPPGGAGGPAGHRWALPGGLLRDHPKIGAPGRGHRLRGAQSGVRGLPEDGRKNLREAGGRARAGRVPPAAHQRRGPGGPAPGGGPQARGGAAAAGQGRAVHGF